jgi:hypothetical protein
MAAATLGPLNTTATPIQEERFVTLGGIEQWITIRGANRANPVLLIVHGGPGDAQSGLRSIYAVMKKTSRLFSGISAGPAELMERIPTHRLNLSVSSQMALNSLSTYAITWKRKRLCCSAIHGGHILASKWFNVVRNYLPLMLARDR